MINLPEELLEKLKLYKKNQDRLQELQKAIDSFNKEDEEIKKMRLAIRAEYSALVVSIQYQSPAAELLKHIMRDL